MKILCLGEVLIDMLSAGAADQSEMPAMNSFQPYAGGAPANVAVAVAKLGGQGAMVSKVGDDTFGRFLQDMLSYHNVNTDYVWSTKEANTALAFVNLDKDGERSFDFYVDNAAHKHIGEDDLATVACDDTSVLHFCSGSISGPELLPGTDYILNKAKQENMLVCLDINYRPAFWDDTANAPGRIDEVAKKVSILKASREELAELYGEENAQTHVQQWLDSGVKVVLVTDGGEPIQYITKEFSGTLASPKMDVKDTTAAGDSFIGGFLYFLSTKVANSAEFDKWASSFENVSEATEFAIRCGAYTVTQYGAFSALPTMENIAK
ncbi:MULTISPECIES: carbohydrate kinase family protein [Alteromonas]|jgi:fructokinase|uniref:Carbohydrate kinase n=1 Tax=Alteromonas stellipolaris TaxID=233316 RepID=A0AAW7YZ00_9ALTE|nr:MULTISPECIES: carbohydrate kinase [Alteromonas]AMJ92205.1 sugar kinase [Alteromonas sp. Mac2]ALM92864.1 Fructokinase [Alteromonas stellipolaris LMG 21856]AMJ75923.1 sugar kinase [Alteromonas stellipolaris]AMJ88350.1 sugar kinase [Alteromonas sp. Mac1]AMJ96041.1 sugar kinase [Alteromonas stellipolaris]